MSQKREDKKKKQDKSWLETAVLMFLQHSMKQALEMAIDEVEKEFSKK